MYLKTDKCRHRREEKHEWRALQDFCVSGLRVSVSRKPDNKVVSQAQGIEDLLRHLSVLPHAACDLLELDAMQ